MRPAGYAARPNCLLNPSLTEPQSPRSSSARFAALFGLSKTPTEPIAAPSRYVAGALPQLLTSAVSDSTIHDLFRNHAQTGRLNGRSPSWPSVLLPHRDCSAGPLYSKGPRLRSSPLRSDALHSAAHTCIPGNASTRKRHSENASVCLQGWRSRSDWRPGGHSKRRGSADSIERQQNARQTNSMRLNSKRSATESSIREPGRRSRRK
jgi:hypothetical protein